MAERYSLEEGVFDQRKSCRRQPEFSRRMLSLFATEKKQHLVKCFCELSLLLDSQIHCLAAQHNLLRGETNIPYRAIRATRRPVAVVPLARAGPTTYHATFAEETLPARSYSLVFNSEPTHCASRSLRP